MIKNPIINEFEKQIEPLKNPNLLYNIIKEVHEEGVVGEEETILVLISKIMLRLVRNSKATSSNIVVSDDTGAGKDYVVSKTCEVLLPKNNYHHFTDISEKALDYWQPLKPVDEWDINDEGKDVPTYDSLDGHVIHFEDPKEEAISGSTFRIMASGGNESLKVAHHKSQHNVIDGKPVMIVTSLNTLIDIEGIRRWDAKRVDTSEEQTKEIKKEALRRATQINDNNEKSILRDELYKLSGKKVIIPYAKALADCLPDTILSRTKIHQLLDYIKASTVLYQHQREHPTIAPDKYTIDEDTLIANGFDYEFGRFVFNQLNKNAGIALNKDEEQLLKVLRKAKIPLKIAEIAPLIKPSKQWIYRHLDDLERKGIIEEVLEYDQTAYKDVQKLKATETAIADIPSTKEVLTGFNEVLTTHYKEGFNGFNSFNKLLYNLDKTRKKQNLKPIFTKICENHENCENLSVEPVLKPCENPVKTNSNNGKRLKEKLQQAIKIIQQKPKDNWDDVEEILGKSNLDKAMNEGLFQEPFLGTLQYVGGA